jgi:hypothetical protein
VLTINGRDIAWAPYGEHWRQLRKIAIAELLSARRVLSFPAIREEEVAAVLRDCAAAAAESRPWRCVRGCWRWWPTPRCAP